MLTLNNTHGNIKFFWIASHVGLQGNKDADQILRLLPINQQKSSG